MVTTPLFGEEVRALAEYRGGPRMEAYAPSVRELLGNAAYDAMGRTGTAHRMRQEGMLAADFVPVLGDALAGDDAGRAAGNGDWVTAALLGTGAVAGLAPIVGDLAAKYLKNLASKHVSLYDFPVRSSLPIETEYPKGVKADEAGRLLEDIEGRPFSPTAVTAGRSRVGDGDEALRPEEYVSVAEKGTGSEIERVAPSSFGGGAGAVEVNRYSRRPEQLYLSNRLTTSQEARVLPHEVAHVVDQLAGEIPTEGLSRELGHIYNTGFTGTERPNKWTLPNHVGYSAKQAPRELMAEALRAYMSSPAWLKQTAPKTAKRIREFVNDNPGLRNLIQFNAVSGLMGASAISQLLGATEEDEQ